MDNLFGIVAWPTRDSWGGYNCIRIPILLTGDNYRTLLVNVQTILLKIMSGVPDIMLGKDEFPEGQGL